MLRRLLLPLSAILILTLNFTAPADAGFPKFNFFGNSVTLDRTTLKELHSLALHIHETYPPNEYHYVGLGRTPTPLIAILQEIDNTSAVNIPFSRTAFSGYEAAESGRLLQSTEPEKQVERQALIDHLERFVPPTLMKQKKILVIDAAFSGGTSFGAHELFQAYARLNGFAQSQVHSLALNMGPFQLQRVETSTFHVVELKGAWPSVARQFQSQSLKKKDLSEFARFNGGDSVYEPRPRYAEFRSYIGSTLIYGPSATLMCKSVFQ